MKNQFYNIFLLFIALSILHINNIWAQTKEEIAIEKIYREALSNGKSYAMLKDLCLNIGARPSGSPQAAAAVEWARQQMESMGFDRVYLQEVMVPYWVRGDKEKATLISKELPGGTQNVNICALGGSIGTPQDGLTAEVIEVQNFNELTKLGKNKVKGKIVFFNRSMDPTHVNTFHAYGGAVNQRSKGAIEAAKLGAVGVIVRSMTLSIDQYPHTGAMNYENKVTKIPAAAISTEDADLLSRILKKDKATKFYYKMNPKMMGEVKSYNVIGEIKGTTLPDEIIVVGGHLDSWDMGHGAHDDGAGCVQSMEALRVFKTLKLKPKRTLRCVLFMNEEFGLRGGLKYAEEAKNNNEKHIAAIESDAGGFSPRGFSIDSTMDIINYLGRWKDVLGRYGILEITKGYGGADIGPLKKQGTVTIGLMPESQRYFDYHHADTDTFDKVNKRELELGGAAMAALMYIIAEFGWDSK